MVGMEESFLLFSTRFPLRRGCVAVYNPAHESQPSVALEFTVGVDRMRIAMTRPLFAWDCLDDSPSLHSIRQFLALLPDGKLLDSLRRHRGKGRNDYPVSALWGVVLLTPLLRHASIEGCLGELRRNPSLRRLIGIEQESGVPNKWNVSRFQQSLGCEPHLTLLREVFDTLVQRLGQTVKDLGSHLAGDATALNARPDRAERESAGAEALAQPTGGRKEYTDDEGKVTEVLEWFGYKLHLLVDNRHEVAVAYRVSSAHAGDNEELPDLVTQAQANLPDDRIQTLSYDRAADDGKVHEFLHDAGIAPIIHNRSLWTEELERVLEGHPQVVYDEAGTIYCYDTVSPTPVRRRMAYIGHEPSRGTIKYRCPAKHGGFSCPSLAKCNRGLKYGKTVRVRREIDLRRFPPIPRSTKKFQRLYRGRTAVERVNGRLKLFWGVDDGNVTGAARFHAMVGAVMVVHVGLATLLASAPRHDGGLGGTRLTPVAKALAKSMGR